MTAMNTERQKVFTSWFTRQRGGFTLIELLVVIAIIGLLASVVLASLNSAREKGADARRKADLKSIQLALELYYDEHETYHVAGTGSSGNGAGWVSYSNYPETLVQGLVDEGYLGGVTSDPDVPYGAATGNSHGTYMIYPYADGGFVEGYCLFSYLADPSPEDISSAASAPITVSTRNAIISDSGTHKMKYAVCGG